MAAQPGCGPPPLPHSRRPSQHPRLCRVPAAAPPCALLQVEQFWDQCDPTKENMCLYGYSDGTWEVTLPCEEVPPELPEPTLGINFARDGARGELLVRLLFAVRSYSGGDDGGGIWQWRKECCVLRACNQC